MHVDKLSRSLSLVSREEEICKQFRGRMEKGEGGGGSHERIIGFNEFRCDTDQHRESRVLIFPFFSLLGVRCR